ncbi:MAG: hypothetical protein ACLS3M_05330 [Collinsella sp.]
MDAVAQPESPCVPEPVCTGTETRPAREGDKRAAVDGVGVWIMVAFWSVALRMSLRLHDSVLTGAGRGAPCPTSR